MRPELTLALWKRQLRRYVDWCAYCGKTAADVEELHLEHIVPRSKGGPDDPSNLTLACKRCNFRKGVRNWSLGRFTVTVEDIEYLEHYDTRPYEHWCNLETCDCLSDDPDYRTAELVERWRDKKYMEARRDGITPDWSLDDIESYYLKGITPEPMIDVRWMLNLGAAS